MRKQFFYVWQLYFHGWQWYIFFKFKYILNFYSLVKDIFPEIEMIFLFEIIFVCKFQLKCHDATFILIFFITKNALRVGFNISEAFPYPGITGQNLSPSREIPGFNFFLYIKKMYKEKLHLLHLLFFMYKEKLTYW